MELKKMKLTEIKPYGKNPRKNDGAVDAVAESIKQCGYCSPIVVDENYEVLAGHTRLKALKKLGRKECEVVVKEGLTEEQKQKYRILDNKTGEFAEWDLDVLQEQLKDIDFEGFDFGFADIGEMIDTGEDELIGGGENPSLNQVFIVPPFSVLDTKQGYWQDRKRQWNGDIDTRRPRQRPREPGEDRTERLIKIQEDTEIETETESRKATKNLSEEI